MLARDLGRLWGVLCEMSRNCLGDAGLKMLEALLEHGERWAQGSLPTSSFLFFECCVGACYVGKVMS